MKTIFAAAISFGVLAKSVSGFSMDPSQQYPSSPLPEPSAELPEIAEIPAPVPTAPIGEGVRDMPGVVAPLGFFDPLGFSEADMQTMKFYRESEIQHGRVSMLAIVGFLAQESIIPGPAISHLSLTPQFIWVVLVFTAAFLESVRAQVAFVGLGSMRTGYQPGSAWGDPLGWAPQNPIDLKDMQTKELQNGRLAMIGAMGVLAQELVTKSPILG